MTFIRVIILSDLDEILSRSASDSRGRRCAINWLKFLEVVKQGDFLLDSFTSIQKQSLSLCDELCFLCYWLGFLLQFYKIAIVVHFSV